MADKCESERETENKGVSKISLVPSQVRKEKSIKSRETRKAKRAMKKLKKKQLKNKKSLTISENHDAPYHDVYKMNNGENILVVHDVDQNYERINNTDQLNLVSDWNRNVRKEHYSDNRFADQNRNFEIERTIYNESFHNRSLTNFEMRGVHRDFVPDLLQQSEYFNNQVQVLYEENLRLKEELNSINQQWPSSSNNEVEIIFRRKDLQKKLLPVLQDIVEGLVREKFSVEDLKRFLTDSYSSSSPKNNRQSPEGDLFSLDISSIPDPDANTSIPKYETSFSEILQSENQNDKNQKSKIARSCFNCSEDHHLSECPYAIDYKRVAAARKRNKPFYSQNVRYHVHGSKESEFKPGLPSDDLREAMGLMSNQIPLYIYQMRILGYPPGWKTEAAVESSGITVYGSDGNVDVFGHSEDGSSGVRTQYDPDKLVDYPGFNVVLPRDFVDEADKLGYPPIAFQDLRCVQESYMVKPDVRPKRKQEFVENKPFKVQRCEVDMEMEDNSDDEVLHTDYEQSLSDFVPPLPIETLPPPPPDDPPLPPEDDAPLPPPLPPPPIPPPEEEFEPLPPGVESPSTSSFVPHVGFNLNSNDGVSFGECWKEKHSKEAISGTSSPSLRELEEIKKRIVMELTKEMLDEDTLTDDALRDNALETGLNVAQEKDSPASSPRSPNEEFVTLESSNDTSTVSETSVHSKNSSQLESSAQNSEKLVRSESRTSISKFMTLGTPSLSRHSSFTKLPDYEQFSKNVTSHMHFENLPNSTGAFLKLKGVLKKVKEKMKFI